MTEIVISVATDLKVTDELKAVGLVVHRGGLTKIENKWDLSTNPVEGFITLPATIGLLPGGDLKTQLQIDVLGFNKDPNQADVERTAKLHFIEGSVLWLRMNLLKRCLYIHCPDGQTCGDKGTCESNEVKDPPLWAKDANIGQVDTGAHDGGIDAAPDSRPPDAPPPDTLKPDTLKPDAQWPDGSWCRDSGWCNLPSGSFTMGSPDAEPCRQADEPQHKVTLTRRFEMMQREVSEQAFIAFTTAKGLTYTPAWDKCGLDCPADNVSWHLAAAYCNELTTAAKDRCFDCTYGAGGVSCTLKSQYLTTSIYYDCPGYRLPTDAEWEYAYRAGTTTAYYSGPNNNTCTGVDPNASKIGWYGGNNLLRSPPRKRVGALLLPNAWGLYDLPGNIWEWCYDGYDAKLSSNPLTDPVFKPAGGTRVMRGGDYGNDAQYMRAANRADYAKTFQNFATGFRCVRSR